MHIFGRRRKESSQPSPTSPPGRGAISVLSASLPRSYRQQNSSSSGLIPSQKTSNAALPATPTHYPAASTSNAVGKENAAPGPKARAHHATAPASGHGPYHASEDPHSNEFGQIQHARPSTDSSQPAFMVNGGGAGQQHHHTVNGTSKQSLPAIPRDSSSKDDLNLKALPTLKIANRRMSTGSIPSIDAMQSSNKVTETAELQLCYGYWPIETQLELNLVQIEEIVRLCGQEIRTRDIEAPLLFSTQALDISMAGICSLIRSYLSNRDIWRRDLRFSTPHDLCGMIKWALGRYVNPQGGRGFLAWETYERWRFGEREKEFPPRYITTHMLYLLPTQTAALVTTLFSLLTSALAYTTKNGCTVRKLATLFSSYIFGLPDDGTFEHTYTAFNRFSLAMEHLLLAYMRDQIHQHHASGAVTALPVRLCNLVKDYAQNLPTNLNKPPQGADLQVVVSIRRHVRWYSKNLIASAGTWEVPRSKAWALIAPAPNAKLDDNNKPSPFAYSSRYKHLLNIRSIADEEDEEDMQKFSSMVEKEWKSFMQSGFAAPDNAKLRFDLTESDRANRRKKHETIDWTTFESSGFQGRESFLDVDLNFNPGVNDPFHKEDLLSEARAKLMADRARNFEKSLPSFNYDITPQEERSMQIDKQFLEVYSDVLCSSGWTREEVKASSWALIQFKTRPKSQERPASAGSDGRTEEAWFLVEELVPADYRVTLLEQAQAKPKSSRRISFLRPVRKKQSKQPVPAMPEISKPLGFFNRSTDAVNRNSKPGLIHFRQPSPLGSGSPNLKTPDDSVFVGGPTKIIKLSNSILSPGISKASSLHEDTVEAIDTDPVVVNKTDSQYQLGGSQDGHAGLGYSKPTASTGSTFLDMVRKTTRRTNRRSLLSQADSSNTVDDRTVPHSPASTIVPASPGFNLAVHGVDGPGRPIDNPNEWMDRMARMSSYRPDLTPQRYERSAASYTGTSRSIETRVTSGHSDTSGNSSSSRPQAAYPLECLPSSESVDGRDSASLYDRDLPAPPDNQAEVRPFSSATRDAEELVAAYSNRGRDSTTSQQLQGDDPYDGIADDEETTDSHLGHRTPESSSSAARDLPTPPVQGLTVPSAIQTNDEPHLHIRKPLRNVSHDLRDGRRMSKPLPSPHDVQELLKSPVIPVNGTGKVGNLAGKFGGALPKAARPSN